MKDDQIVSLYWDRNEDAIHQTQMKYGSYLAKVAYNILADYEDSQECVNDTYLAAWNSMPVTSVKALQALCKVYSGELSNGWPSLLKNEHNIERVGSFANGSTKAVRKRGTTYKSLLPASINEKRLEPSTRSPQVRMVSKYSRLLMTKFKVFKRPSPAGYMKLTMVISFS